MPAFLRWRATPRAVALVAALACVAPCAAFELRPRTAGLDVHEAEAAHRLTARIATRLPPAWREALRDPVDVRFTDRLPADVHGRAFDGRVLLQRSLLSRAARAGEPDPADAALVHELAHLFDRSAQGGLSRDARLLELAGWRRRAVGGRARASSLTGRTGDPYELAAPREFVALNLERFLLDPAFACRRPALHAHLAARLGDAPARMPCAPGHPFVQMDAAGDAGPPLLDIDPARVAGVDYLLAEPGRAAMSRWGHGMLRLVVCAPHRRPGPACRLDLEHHRVLSFRAFVDGVQVSSWRGLTGDYPSRLFVLPLAQVVDEYTKVELRGLRSVPLRLERDEVAALLERAAQLHWSYDGRYYFATNNCAVETWRLLAEAMPARVRVGPGRLTPTGLLRGLERAGLADAVPADAAEARRLGYHFESQEAHYQAMFEVARSRLALPTADVRAWLGLAPSTRAPWLDRGDLRATAALLLLEGAALRREEQGARDALAARLLRRGAPPGAVGEALRLADRLSRPAALAPDGYGIPQAVERDAIAERASAGARQWREASARLRAEADALLPASRRARLRALDANLARLGERVRALHRAEGGLELDAAPAAPARVPQSSSSSSPASPASTAPAGSAGSSSR